MSLGFITFYIKRSLMLILPGQVKKKPCACGKRKHADQISFSRHQIVGQENFDGSHDYRLACSGKCEVCGHVQPVSVMMRVPLEQVLAESKS
jgi:hypothetical protein